MNRLKIEWPRKFVNRKHLDKERFGNKDKFGIHENRIKRQLIKKQDFEIHENKIKMQQIKKED